MFFLPGLLSCTKDAQEPKANPQFSNTEGYAKLTIPGIGALVFTGVELRENKQVSDFHVLNYFNIGNDGNGTKDYVRIGIGFGNYKLQPGKQRIHSNEFVSNDSSYYAPLFSNLFTMLSFDISGDWYEVLEADSLTNHLELVSIDEETGWVTGKFTCSYYRTEYGFEDFPDTIRINNAEFKALIK